MSIAPAEKSTVLHAYRQLYRHGLQAIHYSSPARYTLRETLRSSFRTQTRAEFDAKKVENTLSFLHRAALDTGMEHKLVKNILHVRYWASSSKRSHM